MHVLALDLFANPTLLLSISKVVKYFLMKTSPIIIALLNESGNDIDLNPFKHAVCPIDDASTT